MPLAAGWNAVYLELEPDLQDPDALFGALPIDQVALWLPSRAKVASLTDPAAIPNKPSDWLVWHPNSHPAAFLNTLKRVQAHRALLIKASAPTTLTITGTASFQRHAWLAPSFNLKGFEVDPLAPPTFARFFDGSRAHDDLKVFRLVNNAWKAVSPTDVVRRGEAYWVWCQEGTDFQGPLDLTVSLGNTVRIDARANGTLPITLTTNVTDTSLPLRTRSRQRLEWPAPSDLATLEIRGGSMAYRLALPSLGN